MDLEAVTKAIATARLGPVLHICGWEACLLRSCYIDLSLNHMVCSNMFKG